MKINISLTKEDEQLIANIKNKLGIEVSISGLIRAGLNLYWEKLNNAFLIVDTVMNKVMDVDEEKEGRLKRRKYTDEQVEEMVDKLLEKPFMFCPIHTSGYISSCKCDRESIINYYKEQYI